MWIHSGQELDAIYHIMVRGMKNTDLGAECSESTPVETVLPTGTASVHPMRILEAGSPTLNV
jgi:putative transposase